MQKSGVFILVLCMGLVSISACQNTGLAEKWGTQEKGRVYGKIGLLEGNCMLTRTGCKPGPIKTTVYVTKPAEQYDQKLLIKSTETNEKGEYEAELPVGEYSLFVEQDGSIICTYWGCEGGRCICNPLRIRNSERTEVNSNLNRG